jgi:hypothetical protein
MVKRCKDCPWNEAEKFEKVEEEVRDEEVKPVINEHEWEKRFSFPKYWVQVYAKNIHEANKKLQSILTSEEK